MALLVLVILAVVGTIWALAKEWKDPDSPLNIPYSERRDRSQWP